MRAQLRSNLEPRKVLGTRAVSRARAHPDHLDHFRVYHSLEPLEIIRRQVCLGVRTQVVSSVSGYLEAASSHLELPGYLERPQDISRVLQVISSRSR